MPEAHEVDLVPRLVIVKKPANSPTGVFLIETSDVKGPKGSTAYKFNSVSKDSPLAGKVAEGDILLSVNDLAAATFAEVKATLFEAKEVQLLVGSYRPEAKSAPARVYSL